MTATGSRAPASRNQRLFAFLLRYQWWFIAGSVALVVTNLLALRIPRELGHAVQALKEADTSGDLSALESQIIGFAIAIILLAVGAAIARIISRILIFNAGRKIEYDLRNETFEHITRLSQTFFNKMPTGDLTSRVVNDTTYVRLLFGLAILQSVNTVISTVLAVSLMAELDWRLTLFCVLPFPLIMFTVQKLARALHVRTHRVQAKLSELSSLCQENLSGVSVIKAYAVEDVEADRFSARCEEYVSENLRLAKVRGVLFPLMMAMGGLGSLMVLYFGGRSVIDGDINLGQFVEFSGYVGLLAWPMMAMGWVISVWHRGTAAFDRVYEILDSEPEILAPSEDAPDTPTVERGEITFANVSFKYDRDGPSALEDIDLTIQAGSRVGIVGRSGAGKTTLVRLVARLYDPTEGEIRIDGVPLAQYPLRTLRGAIGFAPQEPFLFSTTVEKNLRFGTGDEPAANGFLTLEDAVQGAQLDNDIDAFPKGLQTMVGERGITLSGGQRQRVALARAAIMSPRILILDDSLSSVDTRTERAILDFLEELMRDRTAIVVTHRYSVLEQLDEVLVIEEGRLTERGTHRELVKRGGVYAQMVRREQLTEEISAL